MASRNEDLKQQLKQEANRLRELAGSVRAGVERPDLKGYVRSGRGPKYQEANDAYMGTLHAAEALKEAAYYLEQATSSHLLA